VDTDAPGTGDAPGDAAAAYDGLSRCDVDAAPRAMLVAVSADDRVDLYTLRPGHLTDTGVHLTGMTIPGQIVMRDDGMEALVVYGGYGQPFGVGAITVMPDGSTASVEKVVQIGTDSTPMSVTYVDHDHAVVALAGATDQVVGLTRGSSGWVAGTRVATPAEYPLGVRARPGTQDVLLSRSQVGVDTNLDVYRLQAMANGTWHSAGAHASVGPYPIAFAVHPTGNAFYVPTADPASQPSSTNLDAPGQMHAVTIGATTFSDGGTVATPRIGSLIAADPGGHFVVTEGNVYILDAQNNPEVTQYTFQTVRVGPDGALGEAFGTTPPTDGLLFDDLEVAPSGHLVAAREMYMGSVPAAQQYPLELWAQPSWGAWQLCDTAYLSNGAHVAIGP
jgi:hypothetical protein